MENNQCLDAAIFCLVVWRFLGNWNSFLGNFHLFFSTIILCSAKYCLALPASSHHGAKREIIFLSLTMAFSFLNPWQTTANPSYSPSFLTSLMDYLHLCIERSVLHPISVTIRPSPAANILSSLLYFSSMCFHTFIPAVLCVWGQSWCNEVVCLQHPSLMPS